MTRVLKSVGVRFFLTLSFILSLSSFLSHAGGEKVDWLKQAKLVEAELQKSLESFKKNDITEAKRLCDDAYFGVFEEISANMEVAIRQNISLKKVTELESAFAELRKSYSQKKPLPEIEKIYSQLVSELQNQGQQLNQMKVRNP